MAPLVFVISLVLALLALQGWPVDASPWMRALTALASLMMGVGIMALLAPSPQTRKFRSGRKPGTWDQLVGGLCIAIAFGALYFILVYAPPATRQFSEYVVTTVKAVLGAHESDGTADPEEPESVDDGEGAEQMVGAMFDPNGALVPKSANLTPSAEPSISLKMAGSAEAEKLRNSGQIYLHLFSHHQFDGERWTSQGTGGALYLSCDPDGLIRLKKSDQKPDYQYTILHHEPSNGLDALCTLQGARYVGLPEILRLNEGTWLLPPPDNPLGIIRPYPAGSSPRKFREMIARDMPIVPGDAGPEHLARTTDVGLNIQVLALAERFRQKPTLEAQLVDLRDWLSNSFGYTLEMDYPDKEKSALESFLDNPGASEGFCVHFASAAALVLRELGVPSRVSYGWTGGEYYPEHHQFVFRAKDGHAWTEIYLKDQGWVVFETTPTTALPQSDAQPLGAQPPVVEEYIDDDDDRAPADKSLSMSFWKWMLVPLGLGIAVLFALLLLKRGRLAHSSFGSRSNAATSPPGYLQLFYRTCADRGHPKPVGDTLLQYLEQLDADGVSIPFGDDLLAYHYKVTYREAPRDPDAEKQLRRQIKNL